MATLTVYASNFDNSIPSGFSAQFTNPTNAVGSAETSQATAANTTQTADIGNYFAFDLSGIPASSTINSVTLEVRDGVSTNNRGDTGYRLDATAGTAIATEVGVTGMTGGLPAAGTAKYTNSTWSTTPTLAQLQAASFRVRMRWRHTTSTVVTYSLDWVRLTVDYTPPAQTFNQSVLASTTLTAAVAKQAGKPLAASTLLTPALAAQKIAARTLAATSTLTPFLDPQLQGASGLNTAVRVSFPTPRRQLATGADKQEVRVLVRKAGTGVDPTARVELYESGGAAPLATLVADTAVSSTTGVVLSGRFDASLLADISGAGVEVRVVGTASSGASVEVGAVEWNAFLFEFTGALFSQTLAATLTASAAMARQAGKLLPATVSLTAVMARAVYTALLVTLTLLANLAKSTLKLLPATASLSGSIAKRVSKLLAATASLAASLVAQKVFLKTLAATLALQAVLARQVSRVLAGALTVSAILIRLPQKVLAVSLSLAAVSLKRVSKVLPATLALAPTLAATKQTSRTLAAALSVSAVMSWHISRQVLLARVLNLSAALIRAANKPLVVTLSTQPVLNKLSRKILSGLLGLVGRLTIFAAHLIPPANEPYSVEPSVWDTRAEVMTARSKAEVDEEAKAQVTTARSKAEVDEEAKVEVI